MNPLFILTGSKSLPIQPGGWVWRGPISQSRVLQLFKWPSGEVGIAVSEVFDGLNATSIWNLNTGKQVYGDGAETRIGAAPEYSTGALCFGCEWGNNQALFLWPDGHREYGAKLRNWSISAVEKSGKCYVSGSQTFSGNPSQYTDSPTLRHARTGRDTAVFRKKGLVNNMAVHDGKIYATTIFTAERLTLCEDGRSWPGDALMLCSYNGDLYCTTGAYNVSVPDVQGNTSQIMRLDFRRGWQHVATIPGTQGSALIADHDNDRLLATTFPQQALWAIDMAGKVAKLHSGPKVPQHADRSFGSSVIDRYVAYTGADRAYVYEY